MRVVIDPNLLVSYLLTHRGPIAQLLDFHLAQGNFNLLACVQLLEELDRVLQYPKFQRYFDGETRLRFVALVAALSESVDMPDDIPQLLRDPKDDYLISCALAGYADFIISGDKDLLEWKAGAPFKILTARQLLNILGD
ncbi:MAG: putative toxin-antitoxin system toxin component, PIN family [Chloroflexota bacterium]